VRPRRAGGLPAPGRQPWTESATIASRTGIERLAIAAASTHGRAVRGPPASGGPEPQTFPAPERLGDSLRSSAGAPCAINALPLRESVLCVLPLLRLLRYDTWAATATQAPSPVRSLRAVSDAPTTCPAQTIGRPPRALRARVACRSVAAAGRLRIRASGAG
jgi:hypothetical protein